MLVNSGKLCCGKAKCSIMCVALLSFCGADACGGNWGVGCFQAALWDAVSVVYGPLPQSLCMCLCKAGRCAMHERASSGKLRTVQSVVVPSLCHPCALYRSTTWLSTCCPIGMESVRSQHNGGETCLCPSFWSQLKVLNLQAGPDLGNKFPAV